MQTMLLRYADNRNLTIALPEGTGFQNNKMFKATYVVKFNETQNGSSFDFITHHLRFNPKETPNRVF
ncbi:hypothetical protein AAFF_G00070480 [Aldrovandia affinis]|uniref:Uncharacterized protein n=1 Tax=Aldrovandia affinis TaxID=143900 RepID=A0AAD7RYW6_9TELE|nr:hypothetical protein AAFF_G00070480 [Aldrovandia affinis]